MKQRIITAICLLIVALPCVILGGYFFKGLVGVVLALSVYEMLHICTRPKIKLYIYPLVFLFFSMVFYLIKMICFWLLMGYCFIWLSYLQQRYLMRL